MSPKHRKNNKDLSQIHSELVMENLAKEIKANQGWISFEDFFDFVMYKPGLGYYSAGAKKLGPSGDFTTSPEISRLFGKTVSNQVIALLNNFESPSIIEIGAGSGKLAYDIINNLINSKVDFDKYYILEVSADFIERQKQELSLLPDEAFEKVIWLDSILEAPVEGIVIGNEVVDALPFKRFTVVDHKIQEIGVSIKNGQLTESTRDADKTLAEEVRLIEKALNRDFEQNYTSEIRLNIGQWLKGISSMLKSGAILFIDYGYSRQEYYAADRKNGSMICHYRNTAHENPFLNLGVQDISASVEFTLLAEKALEEQLEVGLFTSQSDFLINGNILGELDKIEDDTLRMELTQEIKQLLMPSQMGQTFKCMMLYKNISLDSFEGIRDLRHTL